MHAGGSEKREIVRPDKNQPRGIGSRLYLTLSSPVFAKDVKSREMNARVCQASERCGKGGPARREAKQASKIKVTPAFPLSPLLIRFPKGPLSLGRFRQDANERSIRQLSLSTYYPPPRRKTKKKEEKKVLRFFACDLDSENHQTHLLLGGAMSM